MRQIERIVAPPRPHFVGDGFRVHNFIPAVPGMDMLRMDPFLVLDYNSKYKFPPSTTPKGVGVHPHRGFETVTIAYKGKVAHHDSKGGKGVIEEGDVQWMTAASGVLHKEYHEDEWSKTGGEFQMVQLWVNLPAAHKMSEPSYQTLVHNQIPQVKLPNGQGFVEVIAGNYNGVKGAAKTFTEVHLYNLKLKKGDSVDLSFPQHFNTLALAIEGSFSVNNADDVPQDHMAVMKNDGDTFSIQALEETIVLVLSGEPISEPIAAHGPFVMNTKEEIFQAFDDYNKGLFGYLED